MTRSAVALLWVALVLAGCSSDERPCDAGPVEILSPSAGCLLLRGDSLLVVNVRGQGASVPGGKSLPGESAACTAQRETYEETGLWLQTGELLEVFDTGFHLLRCYAPQQGSEPDVGYSVEISEAYWLPRAEFANTRWRFPGQGADMERLMNKLLARDTGS